jgi:transposase
MTRPYSIDLRERVVDAVEEGASRRETATRFGVSAATAVRWVDRHRQTGSVAPGKVGGHRQPVLLPEREWLHARLAAEPDLTLRALLAELHDRGVKASYGALWLFLEREGLSFKKKRVRQRAGSAVDRPAESTMEEISGSARS